MHEESLDQPLKSPLDDLQLAEGAEAERSRTRFRRATYTTALSFGTKVVTMLSTIVTTPIALRYLGAERQGIWMAISSSLVLLSFADLGMGNGLINIISETKQKGLMLGEFFVLLGITLLLAIAALGSVFEPT